MSDVTRTAAAAFSALLAAAGVVASVLPVEAQTPPSAPIAREVAGRTTAHSDLAPDFTRTDVEGRPVSLSRYRGKVVLLNFWATWCPPCLDEIPTFSRWQQAYGAEGLQVIGVSLDDDSAPVRRAVGQFHVVYPVMMSDEELVELYGGVLGLPLSFVIDPSGRIVARYQGKADLAKLEKQLKALLPRP
jgi:thiol-disulfide isomerase/thioredoxin